MPADQATLAVPADAPATPVRPGMGRGRLAKSLASRYGLLLVWLGMAGFYAVAVPNSFVSLGTAQTIFGSQTTLVFLCMAAVATFVVGEFDLSIASTMGLSATTLAVLAVNDHVNEGIAVIIALGVGILCGVINGTIIVYLGIDPIVTTLGMSVVLLGVAQWFSHLVTITGLSNGLASVATYNLGGLPISFYYGITVAVIFAIVLSFTPLGRHMTFVGANREVARLSGIRVQRIRFGSYVFSGVSAAIGGVLLAASIGGFDSTTSGSYLLPALAATFLGTAVVCPGSFNPLGTLVTIYFLVTGIVGLQLMGYAGWVSNVFYGGALVIAITVSTIARSRIIRG
jgi:ribose transport system permease protein